MSLTKLNITYATASVLALPLSPFFLELSQIYVTLSPDGVIIKFYNFTST